jgi:hypothetical protein
MRLFLPRLLEVGVPLSLALTACSSDSAAPRADAPASDGSILTTFDRLTLAPGDRATFRASFIGSAGRLSSAGLAFASRAPSVARVSAANGRAAVQGVATGRTWVLVRSAAATDSVEVIVR